MYLSSEKPEVVADIRIPTSSLFRTFDAGGDTNDDDAGGVVEAVVVFEESDFLPSRFEGLYPHSSPRSSQHEHVGFVLLHLIFATAQWLQLSSNFLCR
jgi:hypothetical protein